MGLFSWIILGALAGWLGSKWMKTGKLGLIANIIIGVVGAFVGGIVMRFFGGSGVTGVNLWSLVVALLGSILFLWVAKKIMR